jgi:hypothetical protein
MKGHEKEDKTGQIRKWQNRAVQGRILLTFIDACRSACALATTPSAAFTSFASSAALASAACFNYASQ